MKDFQVDVTPDVIKWAREAARLSAEDAASELKISTLDLQYIEEGGEEPQMSLLKKMAKLYKRPLAVLFLSEPPKHFDPMRDFRLVLGAKRQHFSVNLVAAFERIRLQQEVARDLAELADEVPAALDLSLTISDVPERAGEQIRVWLGIPERTPERDDDLDGWIALIEDKGILVTHIAGVAIEEMRGCSISDQPFPIIILNGKDSRRGRLFTLMHELSHVLLHVGGMCSMVERRAEPETESETIERYCNRVAAATLVPKQQLITDSLVRAYPSPHRWTEEDLTAIANRFGVSRQMLLVRLIDIDRATWDFYFEREAAQPIPNPSAGILKYYPRKVRDYGRRYVTAVIEAYYNEDINSSELSDFLDLRVDKLPKLEAQLGRR